MKKNVLKNYIYILLFLFVSTAYSQNDNSHQTYSTVICEYNLPADRSGLSVTAFNVTPRIRIDRFETAAWIFVNINAVQGTSSNPNPSFKHSYNYLGKQYGNQDVGYEPFQSIRAENLSYEVMVTYESKIWGWTKVDGKDNRFGPIDINAKASEINVRVRVVNLMFSGTGTIENKIRALLKDKADKQVAAANVKKPDVKTQQVPSGGSTAQKNNYGGSTVPGNTGKSSLPNNSSTQNGVSEVPDSTDSVTEVEGQADTVETPSYILNPSDYGIPDSTPTYTKAELTTEIIGGAVTLLSQWAEESRIEKERIQAENEERERIAEEARQRKRQKIAANNEYLANFKDAKLPLSSSNIAEEVVYYFAFSTDEASMATTSPVISLCGVFPISKYADGTWPYAVTVKKEISTIFKTQGITLNGFYTSKTKAESDFATFKKSLEQLGFTIKPFTYKGKVNESVSGDDMWNENSEKKSATTSDDFWGESNKETAKPVKQETKAEPKKEPAKTDDFWNN